MQKSRQGPEKSAHTDIDVQPMEVDGTKQEPTYFLVDSVEKKFLFTWAYHMAKSRGLDDPEVSKIVSQAGQSYTRVGNRMERAGSFVDRLKKALETDSPMVFTHTTDKEAFLRNHNSISVALGKDNPDFTTVINILERIYRKKSMELLPHSPKLVPLTESLGGAGNLAVVVVSPGKDDRESPKKTIKGSSSADELFLLIEIIEDELKDRTPMPAGVGKLNAMINEVKGNPLMRRNTDFEGFDKKDLKVLRRCINGLRDDVRIEGCWRYLDLMSTQGKKDALTQLKRLSASNLPEETKRDNVWDAIMRDVRIDVIRGMLSWINEGYLFTLSDKVDPKALTRGLKTVGIEDEITQVKRGKSGSHKWTATTNEGKAWILRYDENKGEIRIYEDVERKGNQRARTLVNTYIGTQDVEAYSENVPEDFIKKLRGIGGFDWEQIALPDSGSDVLADVVDTLPAEHKIPFLKLFSRLMRKNKRLRLNSLKNTLGLIKNPSHDIPRTIQTNYYICLLGDAINEIDSLSSKEKVDFEGQIWNKIVEIQTGTYNRGDIELVAGIFKVCYQIDPIEKLDSIAEYLMTKELLATIVDGKPGKEFLQKALVVALNHEILSGDPSDIEKADDVRASVKELASNAAKGKEIVGDIRRTRKFMDFSRMLNEPEGQIDGLEPEELERYRDILGWYEALAQDTEDLADLSQAALELANENPEAAREYMRRYSPQTEVTWDGRMLHHKSFAESRERIVEMVADDEFRKLFIERAQEVRKLRDLEDVSIRDVQGSLADAVSELMCKSQEHLGVITEPGTLKALREGADKGRNHEHYVREFLGKLRGDEPQFSVARAYTVLFKARDRTARDARELILKGDIKEEDLKHIDDNEWRSMRDNPDRIVNVFKQIVKAKGEYKTALDSLDPYIKSEYEKLCNRVPGLEDVSRVNTFKEMARDLDLETQKDLLSLVGNAAKVAGGEKALKLVAQGALASGLENLRGTPYSTNRFVESINKKVRGFKTKSLDDVVTAAYEDKQFQLEYSIENEITDWVIFAGERGQMIKTVMDAPERLRPYLISLGATGIQEALHHDPDYIASLGAFIDENQDVMALMGPLYVQVAEDGGLNVLRGVKKV